MAILTKDEARAQSRGLPKWPQMLVAGKTVPIELAEEIILRTDTFFNYWGGGNDDNFEKWMLEAFGIGQDPGAIEEMFRCNDECRKCVELRDAGKEAGEDVSDLEERIKKLSEEAERYREIDRDYEKMKELFLEGIGRIPSHYVSNSWFSCAYIGGPHGWMHPDGTIGFTDNVGKWPSMEDIFEDWERIAKAFPQLDLKVTLMDGEGSLYSCNNNNPCFSIIVKDGEAHYTDEHLKSEADIDAFRTVDTSIMGVLTHPVSREQYYSRVYIMDHFVPLAKRLMLDAAGKIIDEKLGLTNE